MILVGLGGFLACAHAEVGVNGSASAAKVEARESSIAEVLGSLGAAFAVRYRSSTDLNRPLDGTFQGTVPQILQQILKDYDYILRSTADGHIEVTILKASGRDAVAGSPAQSANVATTGQAGGYPDPRWRTFSYSRGVQRKFTPEPSTAGPQH